MLINVMLIKKKNMYRLLHLYNQTEKVLFSSNPCSNAALLVFLVTCATCQSPRKRSQRIFKLSFKSMLRFCMIIINLTKRFIFATNLICLFLHLYLTHLLSLENVSILILLRGPKKSLDFSIHRSSTNVSIRAVPSLKSLNESETNFSVANIPFISSVRDFH